MRALCPEVGRSQRPDLIAKQRGGRRLSSSANPAASSRNLPRATPAQRRCLIRRRRPRYPASAFTPPTERAGEPDFVGVYLIQLEGGAFVMGTDRTYGYREDGD